MSLGRFVAMIGAMHSAPRTFDTTLWSALLDEEARGLEAQRKHVLEKAVAQLRAYFQEVPVKSVYLTGSVIQEGRFTSRSDVDVAVEGLSGNYFRVLVDLEERIGRGLDLIELEECRFRSAIEMRGLRVI